MSSPRETDDESNSEERTFRDVRNRDEPLEQRIFLSDEVSGPGPGSGSINTLLNEVDPDNNPSQQIANLTTNRDEVPEVATVARSSTTFTPSRVYDYDHKSLNPYDTWYQQKDGTYTRTPRVPTVIPAHEYDYNNHNHASTSTLFDFDSSGQAISVNRLIRRKRRLTD